MDEQPLPSKVPPAAMTSRLRVEMSKLLKRNTKTFREVYGRDSAHVTVGIMVDSQGRISPDSQTYIVSNVSDMYQKLQIVEFCLKQLQRSIKKAEDAALKAKT